MAMVWKEAMDEVSVGLRAIAPVSGLTKAAVFTALTQARHDLQMETGLCVKQKDFDLTTMDASGALTGDGLMQVIDEAEIIAPGQTMAYGEFKPVDNATYRQMMRSFQRSYNGQSPSGMLSSNFDGGVLGVVTLLDPKILVWPYVGLTGTLRIYYQPNLRPYTPSDTVQYPNYATQFDAMVKANGPEPVFASGGAWRGMIAKAKLELVSRHGDVREFAMEIPQWQAQWQNALEKVEKSNPSLVMNAEPPGYFVPVR